MKNVLNKYYLISFSHILILIILSNAVLAQVSTIRKPVHIENFKVVQTDIVEKGRQEKIVFVSVSEIDYSISKTVLDNGDPSLKTTSFGILPEVSIGRWKNDHLFFYGVALLYQTTSLQGGNKSEAFAFLPTFGYQIRFNITDKLYLTPYGKLQAGFTKQSFQQNPQSSNQYTDGLYSGLLIVPFSVTLHASKNIRLLFSLGSFSTIYQTTKFDPQAGQTGYKNTQFTIQAKLNSIGLGAQFKL